VGTLAGKTYEVQVDQGDGRWVVVDIHETRNASIEQAKGLLDSGKYAATKVIAESERTGVETLFEETFAGFNGKPLTIVAINSAPVCKTFDDYFSLESRQTIGRVLRNYLELHALSPLEILYDASHIRMLENSDTLFPKAVQQIAGAQARNTGTKPTVRADALYRVVTEIREKASSVATDTSGYETLREKGIDALIKQMIERHGADKAPYSIRHGFARYLRDGGDWNAKLALLGKLGVEGLSPEAVFYLDESLAEILDGEPAVHELLGGQPDLATAARSAIMLTQGRAMAPPHALSCIEAINDIMHRINLDQTKRILLGWVSARLRGIKKLTREETAEAERQAFTMIIRDLIDIAGMLGGSKMCDAVIRRARICLTQNGEDLTFPDAMARVVSLLPHHAARIGYLAELSLSPGAEDHKALILSELKKTIDLQTSLPYLVPPGSSQETMLKAVDGLKQRLASDGIPQELSYTMGKVFDQLGSRPEPAKVAVAAPRIVNITDEKFKAMLNEKPKHREASKGEILFEEGEIGEEAYLIVAGEIELFKRAGNTEYVIATLKKGEIIGEMSLIDRQPRIASARVLSNAKLLIVSEENMKMRLDRLQQEDRFTRRVMDILVNRLRGNAPAGT